MNRTFAGLGLALSLCAAASGQNAERWEARLTDIKGNVAVYRAGGGPALTAQTGMTLDSGDRITTGADSSAEIGIEGQSVVQVLANSDFTLENAKKSESVFKLSLGGFLAKIKSLLAGENMSVRTPTAVASVRGTEFGVNVSGGNAEETRVGVFDEGKVEVSNEGGSQLLTANQETLARRGQAPLPPAKLKFFKVQRRLVKGLRKRVAALGKTWKAPAAGQRNEKRGEQKGGGREERRERRQKRQRFERRGAR